MPDREWYVLQLRDVVGMSYGAVFAAVWELERLGWVDSRWEDPDGDEDAPRRRRYWLTEAGAEQARASVWNRSVMGEVIDLPTAAEPKREESAGALATFVNVLTVLFIVAAVPVNIWLWTVAL